MSTDHYYRSINNSKLFYDKYEGVFLNKLPLGLRMAVFEVMLCFITYII